MPAKLISIGELIDHSWEKYREHIGPFLSISGWTLIVAVLNVIAVAFYPTASKIVLGDSITSIETFGIILYAISSYVVAPIINIYVLVGLIRLIKSIMAGRGVSLSQNFKEILKRFWPVALISFMYVLIIILGGLIPLLPAGVFALLSLIIHSDALLSFSNILLILGVFGATFLGIRWAVEFYLAPYLVAQDDEKIRASLFSSRKLINGRFWSVFLRIVAPKVVFILFGILMIWLLNMIVVVIFSGVSGLNIDLQVRLTSYTDSVIPLLATVFIQPLIILSDVLLLKSLKGE